MSTSVASGIVRAPGTAPSANQIARQQFDRIANRLGVRLSPRGDVTLRDAACMIGIGRVAEASRLRGWV